jgi:hypothetical protein
VGPEVISRPEVLVLYQKRPPRILIRLPIFSSAVASDTTLGLVVTNLANFLEAHFWVVSGLPTAHPQALRACNWQHRDGEIELLRHIRLRSSRPPEKNEGRLSRHAICCVHEARCGQRRRSGLRV